MNARWAAATGAINGLLAVGLGAFGAHGLRSKLEPWALDVYQTGVDYHLAHALALVLTGIALALSPDVRALRWAAWLYAAGIVLFCGSLYLLAVTGMRALGMITPLGGVAFLAAWLALAVGLMRLR